MKKWCVEYIELNPPLDTSLEAKHITICAAAATVNDVGVLIFSNARYQDAVTAFAPGVWRTLREEREDKEVPQLNGGIE